MAYRSVGLTVQLRICNPIMVDIPNDGEAIDQSMNTVKNCTKIKLKSSRSTFSSSRCPKYYLKSLGYDCK